MGGSNLACLWHRCRGRGRGLVAAVKFQAATETGVVEQMGMQEVPGFPNTGH